MEKKLWENLQDPNLNLLRVFYAEGFFPWHLNKVAMFISSIG